MPSTTKNAAATQPVIPLFTPPPNCFDDVWAELQPCDSDESATCTVFSLGRNDGYDANGNACFTATLGREFLPGTECPIAYTSIDASALKSESTTTGFLTCCPSQQSFTYTETDVYSVGPCVAASATPSGSPPWTVAVSRDPRSSPTSTESIVFDPEKDPLMAPAVFMTYVIQDGISCAPDCQSPYTGGEMKPTAEAAHTGCDTVCQLGKTIFIVVIVVPITVFLLIVGCFCWCCMSSKRRSREAEKARGSRGHHLADVPPKPPNPES